MTPIREALAALLARQRYDEALVLLAAALRAQPGESRLLTNLAGVLGLAGRAADGLRAAAKAVVLAPDAASAYAARGRLLLSLHQEQPAQVAFRRALRLKPGLVQATRGLADAVTAGNERAAGKLTVEAMALSRDGDEAAALDRVRRAFALKPDFASIRFTAASLCEKLGRYDEALRQVRAALVVAPWQGEAYVLLARRRSAAGDMDGVLVALRRLSWVYPSRIDRPLWRSLVRPLMERQRLVEAEAAARIVLAAGAAEEDTAVSMDLGAVLAYQGRADEAVACFRRVLAFDPGNALAHANLLMCLNYLPGLSGRAVREAHEDWARGQAEPLRAGWQPHGNNRDPGRRLRLGYVSADFGRHPVGFFLARVLPAHDREAVEVFCYSCRAAEEEDDLSRRLAGDAGHWRRVGDFDDAALAERVREDGIDILVDLAGHSAGHRLGLFARKPAPVQVSWLGYFATTGMSAFDATIMDADTVPPGAEAEFVEPVIRLPRLRFCYDPPEPAPAIVPPPCLTRGHITFGSFNNLAKLSPAVIALWARVLHAVPASRLVLKWMSLADPLLCRILVKSFSVHGIAPERIEPRGPSPHVRMLAEYGDVDIALDPFPFGGGLTSCETLWMGVPVVTLPGERPASRQTLGFLRCLGLGDLAADSAEDYVVKAAALAADPARLAVLRQDLRGRMAASSLCDGPGFARDLEAALRGLWTEWCARRAIV